MGLLGDPVFAPCRSGLRFPGGHFPEFFSGFPKQGQQQPRVQAISPAKFLSLTGHVIAEIVGEHGGQVGGKPGLTVDAVGAGAQRASQAFQQLQVFGPRGLEQHRDILKINGAAAAEGLEGVKNPFGPFADNGFQTECP